MENNVRMLKVCDKGKRNGQILIGNAIRNNNLQVIIKPKSIMGAIFKRIMGVDLRQANQQTTDAILERRIMGMEPQCPDCNKNTIILHPSTRVKI